MKNLLPITGADALDAAIADAVRLKIELTAATAAMEAELADIQKLHQARLRVLRERIAELEARALDYCQAHRVELFPNKKSRETNLATFGFELTPWRVEPLNRKIKWKEVVSRLLARGWGQAYIRQPAPTVNKEALLADRQTLSEDKQAAAGIQFCQDEQFFLRPKPETAAERQNER